MSSPPVQTIDEAFAAGLVPARDARGHKGTFGRVLAVAGSLDYAGAALMAGAAALRAGSGLVTVCVPASVQPYVAGRVPELVTRGLPETADGAVDPAAAAAMVLDEPHDALLVGPGLRPDRATSRLVQRLLVAEGPPAVIDAGALAALADIPGWSGRVARSCVLTPHPGEFSRLGRATGDDDDARVAAAAAAATEWGQVVVLKGANTVVAAADGAVRRAEFEVPALGSGGTGDVLAGIIASLVGQGLAPVDAASLAVYVHARAGEHVSETLGDAGLMATDLLPAIPRVRRQLAAVRDHVAAGRDPGRGLIPPAEPMARAADTQHRSAWLEIDLDAIRHNVERIADLVGPAVVAPVVKADAYGHGMERVAAALADRVEALCVATLDEAVALRALVPARVLLLYPVAHAEAAEAIRAGVELTVMAVSDLAALQAAARPDARPVAIQLCVESGMHRGGLLPAELASVAATIAADDRFRISGLWSHLASPEDPDSSRAQVDRFEAASRAVREAGLALPPRHLASSGVIFSGAAPALDMVRPGLAIYGVLDETLPLAASAAEAAAALTPAMALKARAVAFSEVPRGGTVGYGDAWRAARPSRVAILPIGYGDGYLRGTQPGAEAIVRGVRRPLVGRVSMDAVAVDVTDDPGVDATDEFVLLGSQGSESITAGVLARSRNTIAWEVLAGMARRLGRVYYPSAGSAHPD